MPRSIRDRFKAVREERYSILGVGKVIVVLVLIIEILFAIILQQQQDIVEIQAGDSGSKGIDRGSRSQHANEQGGFKFRVPREWTVSDEGAISEMVAPGQSLVMTVARVPGVPEVRAERQLLSALRRDYREVRVTKRLLDRGVLDKSTRQIRGEAVNNAGLTVSFAAELPSVEGDLFAFLVFGDATPSEPLLSSMRFVQHSFAIE